MRWVYLLAASVFLLGCGTRRECEAKASRIRKLSNPDEATAALQAARAKCGNTPGFENAALWVEAKKEGELEKQRNDAKALELATARRQKMKEFLVWVAKNATSPHKAFEGVEPGPDDAKLDRECYGPDDPEAGFCTDAIARNPGTTSVSWLKLDPRAFEFSSEFKRGAEVRCAEFGAREIRRWRWKHVKSASLVSHCKLGNQYPELSGMHLWIKNAPLGTYLSVFSDAYLKVAPYDFDTTLREQGQSIAPAK